MSDEMHTTRRGHSLFVSDFVHLTSPVHRHLELFRQLRGGGLLELCTRVVDSTPIAPSGAAAPWRAKIELHHLNATDEEAIVNVSLAACEESSPISGIDALFRVEPVGFDHTRIGVDASVHVRANANEHEARWFAELLSRSILTTIVATSIALGSP